MSEMIERMAKAMWEANRARCAAEVPDLAPWDEETPALRQDWCAFAAAGIEAMRQPTQWMVSMGLDHGAPSMGHLESIWDNMISAALTP